MKALLMYKDRVFDLKRELPPNAPALMQDLELSTLFNAMALGDEFLVKVATSAILSGLDSDLGTIRYRQNVLKDCLKNPAIVRDLYALAVEAIEGERKGYWGYGRYPAAILHRSISVLQMLVGMLKKLRNMSDRHADKFDSEGFATLFAMLARELDDDYFARVQNHLKQLKFRDGVLISAKLGQDNKGANYVLRKSREKEQNWIQRIVEDSWIQRIFRPGPPAFTFRVHPRDESGARALSELNDRGINLVANALAQSTDHILSFFNMLRTELAFYVGCLNLQAQLVERAEPVCFPAPAPEGQRGHSFEGLYDVCLALSMNRRAVGNDANADGKDLVIITGANQGGKSTFLRSIGLAQLMMQCGMLVAAETFSSNVCGALFTHFKREEDATMKSGKLDEELSRMSDVAEKLTPDSMVLFNESFAATNEREGSEIARQIVRALLV
jgi:DNA mismatch repair ATPase MutS